MKMADVAATQKNVGGGSLKKMEDEGSRVRSEEASQNLSWVWLI